MDTRCSRCQAAMLCNPGEDCWCAALPRVCAVPTANTEGCLCPRCLTSKLTSQLDEDPLSLARELPAL